MTSYFWVQLGEVAKRTKRLLKTTRMMRLKAKYIQPKMGNETKNEVLIMIIILLNDVIDDE